jgi:hypothetical protein
MLLAALRYLLVFLTLVVASTCAAITDHFLTKLEVTEGHIMLLTMVTFLGSSIVSGWIGATYISSLEKKPN